MASAYVTSLAPTTHTFVSAGGSVTRTADIGTGMDFLAVPVTWRDRGATISGVTWNAVSMTSMGAAVSAGSQAAMGQGFGLVAPATGSNDLVVTHSSGSNNSDAQLGLWCASGVDQTTPMTNFASNSGSGSSANIVSSVTVASSPSGSLVFVAHATFNFTANLTATPSGYTERQDTASATGYSQTFGDEPGGGSGATSATWNNGAYTVSWVAFGVSVPQATAGSSALLKMLQAHGAFLGGVH